MSQRYSVFMTSASHENDPGRDRLSMTALGARIRTERQLRRLSLEDLARSSEVSRSMLSAIELGAKVPTVLVLDRIAVALGVSVSRLLDEEREGRAIHLPVAAQRVVSDAAGWRRKITSPVVHGLDFETGRLEFDPLVDAGEFAPHHKGWIEHITVERGQLEITLAGQAYLLGEGDALYFESDVIHAFRNPGRSKTVAFIVMSGGRRPL
ncbi:hypothetical protein ROP_71970 [Rhodococcus opacus B4]|uniref:HTH cro/C1-type domain-containing protein n=2 Tax=Rhodococcus opacus TaxID=37919 RepID=C1B633_RHOOB|nr:hypothetical protein ROP_71970 [Rhodococcus opacus B4]